MVITSQFCLPYNSIWGFKADWGDLGRFYLPEVGEKTISSLLSPRATSVPNFNIPTLILETGA